MSCWKATLLTLFPDMFPGPLGVSVVGGALKSGIWSCDRINIRDFGVGKHKDIDDTPAGGGPGMVMRADVVADAIDHARQRSPECPVFYLSPRGAPFTQEKAHELSRLKGSIFLCGRFEGIDERVLGGRQVQEISAGDFVLSGGEIAAMAVIDAVVRLLPGVLGADASLSEESFEQGLLEYPHYTRPREWEGHDIPEVLLSGDHGKVAEWRRKQAELITRERRPDMWEKYCHPKD